MQFKKVRISTGEVLEAPSAPPPNIAGWVVDAMRGVPEAVAALADPSAAVDPCPENLIDLGWLEWTPPPAIEGDE